MWWYFAFLLYSIGLPMSWQMVTLGAFSRERPRRDRPVLRRAAAGAGIVLFTALLCLAGAALFTAVEGTERWTVSSISFSILSEVLLFISYCAALRFCVEADTIQSVYITACAFITEGISSYLYELLTMATPVESVMPLYPMHAPVHYVIYVVFKAAVILAIYFLVGRRLGELQLQYERECSGVVDRYILALMVLFTASNIVIYAVIFHLASDIPLVRAGLECIALVLCVLAYLFMFTIFKAAIYRNQQLVAEQLRKSEREQFKITRENIDIINRKCHDLKHQLRTILGSTGGSGEDRFLRELEDSISIYDSTIQTGNEAINVILSDKSLRCRESGIDLLTVLDGSAFDFIDVYDLNSIFGNLLDNAIEYLKTLLRKEERFIRIVGARTEFGVALTVENYLETPPERGETGLPLTTKGSTDYHGYGLYNVSNIVESYNGVMTVDTAGHLFTVRILFVTG